MMKELPTLSEVYGILIQEQVHQDIGKHDDLQDFNMAHRAEKRRYHEPKSKNSGIKRQSLYCDHCKMQGHSMHKCWKINGYPPRFKNNTWKKDEEQASKANTSINNVDEQGNKHVETKLTEEQYSRLMSILNGKGQIISEVQEVSHTSNAAQLTGALEEAFASW